MLFKKITHGYVVQVFNDQGECVAQRFRASDDVSYEEAMGHSINASQMPLQGMEYEPFEMKQPYPDLPITGEFLIALEY